MRRAASILAVVATLAAVAPAAGQAPAAPPPLLVELARMCIGPDGDAALTAAGAAEAGYSPTPDSLFPDFRGVRGTVGFMKTDSTAMQLVMTADATRRFSGEEVQMKLCGVGVKPMDSRTLSRDIQAALGQPPLHEDRNIFAWLQNDQGRQAIRGMGNRQAIELMQTGGVRFIGIERRGDMSMLIYLVPRID